MFDKNIVWMDLETTGLNGRQENIGYGEHDHLILEIGMIITDRENRNNSNT